MWRASTPVLADGTWSLRHTPDHDNFVGLSGIVDVIAVPRRVVDR